MLVEELKCDKCSPTNGTKEQQHTDSSELDSTNNNNNNNDTLSKLVIAKCLDCNTNLCTTCLLEHQLISSNLSHKLINLLAPEQRVDNNNTEPTAEINNNSIIQDKSYSLYSSDNNESMVIKRRQCDESTMNPHAPIGNAFRQQQQQQQQLQHLQQLQQYQTSQQIITNRLKQQQQQHQVQSNVTNARLVQIEAEINKTYNFYVQMLKERKEYLIKELNTIIQFAILNHTQNVNKQLQVQYQLEMKKQQLEKEISDEYDATSNQSQMDQMSLKNKLNLLNELNNLILMNNQLILQLKNNNPLLSIEFISNFSAIQTSIRNTFGYIRINQSQQATNANSSSNVPSSQSVSCALGNTVNSSLYSNKNSFSMGFLNQPAQNELSVLCDMKPLNNGMNVFSNNSTSTNVSSSSSSCQSGEIITSPVSIMMKKQTTSSSSLNLENREEADEQNSGENEGEQDEDENTTQSSATICNLKQNEQQSQQQHNSLITLSAGSTCSQKSTKSNSSLSSSSSGSSINLANLSSNTKHPLSYLYSNFINNNPKLNNFNINTTLTDDNFASATSAANPSLKSFNSLSNLNGLIGNSSSSSASSQSVSGGSATLTTSHSANLTSQIQLQRSKMIYHCKFGEFGINDGQFTEPSGVTINTNNDIIVADTNSHRIQIFDKDGNFKFKFGECGKRDGQLLYPNRVSIVKQTGDIVVTERSPTHQIQIYNKYGQFLRKFGANILQHPRGVCVDYKGRIVVVECKVMRVIIFDLYGNVLNKFNCSKYLEFPNGVCCSNPTSSNNFREEIYISDNRAHCIKVFDYNGIFIRQIGAEGITNYPIGVGINSNNEILVADNHNNFNLTVFTQDGKLINALESKVKHAQCFDVGLMDDGSIVLASKDYRIYVYKYSTNQSTSGSALEQASQQLILSPVSSSGSTSKTSSTSSLLNQANTNTYDLFNMPETSSQAQNNNLYNLFTNPSSDPFADLATSSEHLFIPPTGTNNLVGSLFNNITNSSSQQQQQQAQEQTDNLNSSFSSLLNLSTSNSSSSANNNLVSILNGIL